MLFLPQRGPSGGAIGMSVSTQRVAVPAEAAEAQAVAGIWWGPRLRTYAGLLSVAGGLLFWELISRVFIANPLFLAARRWLVQSAATTSPAVPVQESVVFFRRSIRCSCAAG